MAIKSVQQRTARLIALFILALAIFGVTSPPLFRNIVSYIVLLGVSYGAYRFSDFKHLMIGIDFKRDSILRASLWGIGLGGLFIFVTSLAPGLSLGLPLLPGAIADNIEFFIIIFLAPIGEEIFFRGTVMGYLKSTKFGKKHKFFAIGGQAVIFALAHVSAYVVGFYAYPTFVQGLSSFQANIGSFISAGVFGLVAGLIVSRKKAQNLVLPILFHMVINFWVLRPFVIVT